MFTWVQYLLGYQQENEKTTNSTIPNNTTPNSTKNKTENLNDIKKTLVIKPEDLKSVNLKSLNSKLYPSKLLTPALARNAPEHSFHLLQLTDKQLDEILNIKLRPIKVAKRKKTWESRHPVLRELCQKIPVA